MRTRDDILSELLELQANPPRSYSGSIGKTQKKNALINELCRVENTILQPTSDAEHHNVQFGDFEINIKITKK
ncbi:hypothetical protein K1Y25_01435 [Mammaliicoccus sciuri]|uniref:hypothetical protein n=1 Tax=Mammaliicoccus sciuri TaxID=1296 RepID=UPI001E3979FE|nr:hypothetical protein [Mammaliicoccus sciuri]MCD8807917.1 hypothetical protein [Mammaliicoccus sciuri]MCD8893341.1 hypothetical protein [Mammaliicoccus sciuri]MCD8911369.1 hypothetical protein [Mammaliicoccus sciuri]